MNCVPIGVFDSGVGGLTVLKEIHKLLPNENLVYFGDTARVPYGNKSITVVRRFCLEICKFLESMQVKMIVVACNTASSLALDFLRRNCSLPIVGVIDPGVRAALRRSTKNRIGIIGTTATIRSEAYQKKLFRLNNECQIFTKPCPLLVPLVEENLLDSEITKLALEMYLSEFKQFSIDALILACTHYPLLKPLISRFFEEEVILIDSATETAIEVAELLSARRIQASTDCPGKITFFVSDSPETFMKIGSPFLGLPMKQVFLEPVWERKINISVSPQ